MLKLKSPHFLFPFLMALITALTMSAAMILIVNTGWVDQFMFVWMRSFAVAFWIAFPVVFFLSPFVHDLVKKICNIKEPKK
jgi:hypothetical protein